MRYNFEIYLFTTIRWKIYQFQTKGDVSLGSRADLAEVKRKLDTDAGSPLLKGSGLQNPSPKKVKRLPISTIREIAKLAASPEKVNKNTVSLDATDQVEPYKVYHSNGMEPALDPHKGPVQVTTIISLPTVQHPLDCKKIEQLVSAYEQQITNGAKLRPIASFLSEMARKGLQLRVDARLSTSNPPDIIRRPLMDMSPQDML